jgi:CHAD domain-containing protein
LILFKLPADTTFEEIAAELGAALQIAEEPVRRVERTLLDTFDWRIHERGGELTLEVSGRMRKLVWREGDQEHVLAGPAARALRFVEELPDGAFRKRLAPVLEMRALLPQVKVTGRSQTLRVLNRDRKTVVRLVFEENRATPPGARRSRPLAPVLRLVPVRGYPRPAERAAGFLGGGLELSAEPRSIFELALEAIGRRAGDYSSKLDLDIAPDQPAAEAVRGILLHLLDVMEANEDGIRDDLDSEFLHDFRVAVRRTRSAQGRFKALFPDRAFAAFRTRFAWLGGATGNLRDLDVYLLEFDDYRSRLAPEVQPHLEPFRAFLGRERTKALRGVVRLLDGKRYRDLKKAWRAYLESEPSYESLPDAAAEPIVRQADRRTWKLHKQLLRDGGAIGPDTPAEALHELRKLGKKLRYMMEFFRGLHAKKPIREAIRTLKQLQDNLGAFQDYEVHQHQLRAFSARMLEEGKTPAETLLAMGTLVDDLARRQREAREEFAARYAFMASEESRALFRDLFDKSRGDAS